MLHESGIGLKFKFVSDTMMMGFRSASETNNIDLIQDPCKTRILVCSHLNSILNQDSADSELL